VTVLRAVRCIDCFCRVGLVALLVPGVALAQGVDEFGAYGPPITERESPQHFAAELRFGPYRPNVDDSVAGTPYADVFGDSNRFIFAGEFDWQALRIPKFGSLGPGFGFGFTQASGAGLTMTGERSGQESTLAILPLYTVAVLRVDLLAREASIPLVPYAKAGLGAALWWSKDGDGTARDDEGTLGRGISYGYHYALGLMLELDFFEPSAARNMDAQSGVNHAYAFFEWYVSDLDGFGSGNQMQVGTSTWCLGLAVEF
jgi:hypothetical protein